MKEAVDAFETWVPVYHTPERNVPADISFQPEVPHGLHLDSVTNLSDCTRSLKAADTY
jgi:hypothetical protein